MAGESWYFLSIKIMLMPKVLNTCLYEMRHDETTTTKLFWPTIQIHACSWYLHLSEIGIFPFSQVAPTDTHSLNISRRELGEKQSKLLFFKQDTSL